VHDLVIRGARPWPSLELADLAVDGGSLSAVATLPPRSGREEWDVGGRIVLPLLVDPHHHLDKACLVGTLGGSRDLADARARFGRVRADLTPLDLRTRGGRVAGWASAHGVGALRTHADVDTTVGLKHVEAALALRTEYADKLLIQVVAFQPAGVRADDENAWRKLEEALELGCEAAGGTTGTRGSAAPAVMDRILKLAAAHRCRVDLHLDETLDPSVQNLAELARLTERYRLEGRVTASHCCSLSVAAPAVRADAIERTAGAGIHVIALPLSNLYLQGRDSGLRGVAPIAELLAAGVNVACGSDNVQDPFMPLGNADPLVAAQVLGLAAQIADSNLLLETVTWRAARAMGLEGTPDWCRPGAAASFAVVEGTAGDDPVASLAPRPLVVRNGIVVRRPGDDAALPRMQLHRHESGGPA
jgi:cytosine deaminase